MCYFFLKTIDKPITVANVTNEVNFGMIEAANDGLLRGIEQLISRVMVPALKAQDNWGHLTSSGGNTDRRQVGGTPYVMNIASSLSTASNSSTRLRVSVNISVAKLCVSLSFILTTS